MAADYRVIKDFKDLSGAIVENGSLLTMQGDDKFPSAGWHDVRVEYPGSPLWWATVNATDLCYFTRPLNPIPIHGYSTDRLLATLEEHKKMRSPPMCECGADTIESNAHSMWCPRHERWEECDG